MCDAETERAGEVRVSVCVWGGGVDGMMWGPVKAVSAHHIRVTAPFVTVHSFIWDTYRCNEHGCNKH